MKPLVPLLCGLVLGACVEGGGAVAETGDAALQVRLVDDYYWPAGMAGQPEVEVFPLVTALVVSRRDGAALTDADEAAARAAVTAHCAGLGKAAPGPSSRFAEGAWAFTPCR